MSRPISRLTATAPDLVLRLQDRRKPGNYREQVKPMNFLITCHVAQCRFPLELPPRVSS